MTFKQKFIWWSYMLISVSLIFFLAPALISAADTVLVLLGVALVLAWGTWSWSLWAKQWVKFLKDAFNEL